MARITVQLTSSSSHTAAAYRDPGKAVQPYSSLLVLLAGVQMFPRCRPAQTWESLPESRELRALVVWFCLAAEVSLEVLPLAPC